MLEEVHPHRIDQLEELVHLDHHEARHTERGKIMISSVSVLGIIRVLRVQNNVRHRLENFIQVTNQNLLVKIILSLRKM